MKLRSGFDAWVRAAVLCAISVFLTVPGARLAGAETGSEDPAELIASRIDQVFKQAQRAVARITAMDEHGRLAGTGFFIDPAGTLYTAYSVGGESEDILVHINEKKFVARRLVADRRSGIAILKIDATTDFLPLARGAAPAIATPVMSVGFPLDKDAAPSFGVVGGFDRRFTNRYFATTHIRANLPVQQGQGGAPLLDLNGRVLGILVSGIDGGSGCHVLPIAAAEKVRSDFLHFGELRHGWIGVTVAEQKFASPFSSAVVRDLEEATPARHSGLQNGDVLIRVGKVPIREPEDVLDGSFFLTAGEEVELEVFREGERVVFHVRPELHHSLRREIAAGAMPGSLDSKTSIQLRTSHPEN